MIKNIEDLVGYLRTFHSHWLSDPRLPQSSIPADLPDGLALLYRELGALVELSGNGSRAPFAGQDSLTPVNQLKRIDGMLEFAWENQGNWTCRCPIGPGDPPVFSNVGELDGIEGFQKVCDSLSHFLITICLQEAVMSARCLLAFDDERTIDVLTIPCKPLWLAGHYVFNEPTHDFHDFEGPGLIMMNYTGLWLGANDQSVLKLIKRGVNFRRID
jgi:hypothetical protein